ncbi:hypothetical protein ESB00_13685, partial [Oleiharenicola lentus]
MSRAGFTTPLRARTLRCLLGLALLGPLVAQTTLVDGTYTNQSFSGLVTVSASNSAINFSGTNTFIAATATFGLNSGIVLAASSAFTIDSASTGSGDLAIASSNAGASFTNQGSLTHSANNSHGQIYAPTFTNEGSITALNTAGYT